MRTPEVISIEVVLNEGKKKFLLPDGSLTLDILAGKYGSWKPYREGEEIVGPEKEVDTPFIVFRKGEYFDRGALEYIFGSDGYHVVSGLRNIKCEPGHLSFIHAVWFEPGDVITFVRIPSSYELQQRRRETEALGN